MAVHGSADAWLHVDGYALGAYAFEFSDEKQAVLAESTTLGDSWPEFLPTGLRSLTFSSTGLYDDATDASNAALAGTQQTSRIVCYGVEGQTVGKKFVGASGMFAGKYTRKATRGNLHMASADFTVTGQVDEGVILQELEAKTADWTTEGADSVDNSASSANGGVGFLQVTAFSGFSGFIGKLRHSADDSTYADVSGGAFSNVTAAPAAQRIAVSGTINRHLAIDGNVTGTGSITVFIGFARG